MRERLISKKNWRDHFKTLIKSKLPELNNSETCQRCWMKVLEDFFAFKQGVWGVFRPLQGEPPLDTTLLQSLKNISWAYPKIQDDDINFYQGEVFHKNYLGIEQPLNGVLLNKNQLEGLLIPGLGFDIFGHRLGRGKGYYDRFLKDFLGFKIGICFSFQYVTEKIPVDHWDIAMDGVLTEQGFNKVRI